MDATPGDFLIHTHAALDAADRPDSSFGDAPSVLAAKWSALHAAADVVASLAGIVAATPGLPAALEGTGRGRLNLARQGIDDMVAMLEPGLSALLRLHAQGGDPRPAATALWQEFYRARDMVLALAAIRD